MTERVVDLALPSLDSPLRTVPAYAPPRRFYLETDRWWIIVVVAGVISFSLLSLYEKDSLWIGVGLFAAIVVILHSFLVSRIVPWIPGMVATVAFAQWVIAPWAAYYVPPDAAVFDMALRPEEYFSYAVPATVLFAVGMYLPLWKVGRVIRERRAIDEPATFRTTCDFMVGVGTLAFLALPYMSQAYRYATELVTYLAFVGAFGLMLVNQKGWGWRMLIVLTIRMAISTSSGLFHEFLLWLAYTVALFVYAKRARFRTMVLALVAGAFFVGVLDEAKLTFRRAIKLTPELSVGDRFTVLGAALADQAQEPVATFTGNALSHFVTRLNQGWIIARTMFWVPDNEPYANGETIINAMRAAIIPRVLDPGKYEAGGVVYFQRFTGFSLYNDTSMNLSVAGEMYANFGRLGGIVGVFAFAYCLGLIYRRFALLAEISPLWWAWAPYILLYAMMAENGIGEGVNQIVKSLVIMFAAITFIPAWQNLRRLRKRGP
jgi:hypothetical protein